MPSDAESVLSGYFQAVLDALKDGVYISDRDGTTVCVNKAYEQLTGLRNEDLVGHSVRELVQRGVFDIVLNPQIVRTGEPAEHVQHLKDGTTLVLSGCPVFDEQGQIRFVVTFARDVSRLMNLTEQIDQQRILMNQTAGQIAYVARQQEKKSHTPTFASPQMAGVLSLVNRIAPTDATVLILGETGVGKDVVARLVHSRSPRHEKLMLKVDCGGISETLTESEIFGYVGGAFTGASSKGKAGYFEIANESTVFLDEIGELPLSMQTRLLRVLQDGEIVRVGSSQPRKVNVRVIAATNKNLRDCVDAGTFRRDLYYRLNVAVIQIPPLRERSEDIAPLAKMFLEEYASKYHKSLRFMDITLEMMRGYSWPGNVRELQNLVHSMAITATGDAVSPQDLPPQISGPSPLNKRFMNDIYAGRRSFKDIMAEAEADFLRRAIEMYGSVQKVAQVFKLDRSTIFRKLKGFPRK
ncbi:MAG: sigma 54-interacting transcriptional regulator [Desulfovibrio sp.]|nr:sigma 54-interacting transcriptional regulator [Desulfovibrio sp.]